MPGQRAPGLGREHPLESILSICQTHRVNDDHTVQHGGSRYRIPAEQVRPGLRWAAVRVEQRLDGTLVARFRGFTLPLLPCTEPPPSPARPASPPPPGRARRRQPKIHWMDNFRLASAAAGERP